MLEAQTPQNQENVHTETVYLLLHTDDQQTSKYIQAENKCLTHIIFTVEIPPLQCIQVLHFICIVMCLLGSSLRTVSS